MQGVCQLTYSLLFFIKNSIELIPTRAFRELGFFSWMPNLEEGALKFIIDEIFNCRTRKYWSQV